MTKLLEEMQYMFVDFDPIGAGQSDTFTGVVTGDSWLDIERWHRVTMIAFRTVGNGKVTGRVRVASDSSGTNATTVTAGTSTNATGLLAGGTAVMKSQVEANLGRVVFDLTHDDIVNALEGATHINFQMMMNTGTDEFGVLYILSQPRYKAAPAANQLTGNAD